MLIENHFLFVWCLNWKIVHTHRHTITIFQSTNSNGNMKNQEQKMRKYFSQRNLMKVVYMHFAIVMIVQCGVLWRSKNISNAQIACYQDYSLLMYINLNLCSCSIILEEILIGRNLKSMYPQLIQTSFYWPCYSLEEYKMDGPIRNFDCILVYHYSLQ